jgi:hypothetical protein
MIQASTQENREQFDAVQERLREFGPDHYVVEAHSERAERELSLLLKQRSLTPDRVRQELIALAQRITDGDLRHVKASVRAKVQYWSARVHTMQPETLSVAKSCLDQLRRTDPDTDRRIVDALILDAEGNTDGALQLLRDLNTPDGRAVFFVTLFRTRGKETALSCFDNQSGRESAGFLTAAGWSNVAMCLAQMDRWEEAASRLAAAQEYVEEWPDLAFTEGMINAAVLLPIEWRRHALEMNPFYTEIRPIEGTEADRR